MNENNPSDFKEGMYGTLYVADHGFADDTGNAPYQNTGIHPCFSSWAYISAFGYSEEFYYLFIPTEHNGNSAVPVGDCCACQYDGWKVAGLGASWNDGLSAGPFYLYLGNASGGRYRCIGGRLVYVPSKKTA